MKINNSISRFALALAIPFALAACDDDGTGPTASGTVTARVSDGAGSSGSAMQSGPERAAEGSFAGEASGNASVQIFSETRGWVDLGSASEVDIEMQSSNETTVHNEASVAADSYTRVRLVLEGGSALIEAGADLGTLVLSADVTMTMGGSDGNVTIEKEVTPFMVNASSNTTIEFDLNSETWVNEANAQAQSATDAEIQSAATVIVS